MSPSKKNILFILTGSIACYKACGILSRLKQNGYSVKVVLSPSSLEFIGKATIEGLTGDAPIVSLFTEGFVMDHIHLNRWADLVIVAPATANYINKIASGIGDDLLTTLFLAHDFSKPFLVAPAMNTKMYLHPTTQESLKKLKNYGVEILETASGVLACGEVGYGRLLEPDLIVNEIESRLIHSKPTVDKLGPGSLKPIKILITGGGTAEPIDDIRVLTNKSTGKTASYLADQFVDLGFDITYLKAETAQNSRLVDNFKTFTTYQDLNTSLEKELKTQHYDWVIHAAAVSDYSVEKSVGKLSSEADEMTIKLKRNEKIIEKIKNWSPSSMLIGFKLTSNANRDEIKNKIGRLFEKSNCDLVVHNDWNQISKGLHSFEVYSKELNIKSVENVQQLASVLLQEIVSNKKSQETI